MALLFALLKSVFLLTCALIPLGYGLLLLIERRLGSLQVATIPRLGTALFLGTTANFFLPLLTALFWPSQFVLVAYLQMLFSLGLGYVLCRGTWPKLEFSLFSGALSALILVIAIAMAYVQMGGVVPGSIALDYGDLPSWYRAAQNIVAGIKPWDDVWIADYGGTYILPELFPLPAVVVAWQMAILGFAPYALEVFFFFFGALALGAFAELVRSWPPVRDRFLALFFALSPALLFFQSHCSYTFLFPHPLLLVAAGVLLLVGIFRDGAFSKARGFLAVGVLGLMLVTHSGTLFYLAAFAGSALLVVGLRKFPLWVKVLAWPLAGFLGLVAISAVAPERFSIFPFLFFNAETKEWGTIFERWSTYNLHLSKKAIGMPTPGVEVNAFVTQDILHHPLSFMLFFLQLLWGNIRESAACLPILLFGGLFAARKNTLLALLLGAGFFYFLINQGSVLSFKERHFFTGYALILLCALVACSFFRRISFFGVVMAIVAIAVVFQMAGPARDNRRAMDRGFLEAAAYLSARMQSTDTIVTNQPKALALVLSRPMRGAHFLGLDREFTDAFLAYSRAHFIVAFGKGASNLVQTPSSTEGYHMVVDKKEIPLVIYERD